MVEDKGIRAVRIAGVSGFFGNVVFALAGLATFSIRSIPTWVFFPSSLIPVCAAGLSVICLLLYAERKKYREMYNLAAKWILAFVLASGLEIWLGYSLLHRLDR